MPGLGRGGAACSSSAQPRCDCTRVYIKRYGLVQLKLEGQLVAEMPRKLIVHGPDITRSVVSGTFSTIPVLGAAPLVHCSNAASCDGQGRGLHPATGWQPFCFLSFARALRP